MADNKTRDLPPAPDNKGTESKGKKTNVYLAVVGTIIVVLLVGIVILLLFKKEEPAKDTANGGKGTVVSEDNVDKVMEDLDKPVEDGYYKVDMNMEWLFVNGTCNEAYVANSADNTRKVYFDLTLADTKELIYSSPYIPLGEKLEGITLDKKPKTGDYTGIVTYHLVDDNNEEISNLALEVQLHIQ